MSKNRVTNQDILKAIEVNSSRIQGLDDRFQGMDERLTGFEDEFGDLKLVINDFATETQRNFERIESAMVTKTHFNSEVSRRFAEQSENLDIKFRQMETRLVTKDYLDDKLADLKGDLIVIAKKQDEKTNRFIGVMKKYDTKLKKDLDKLDEIEIFPNL